MNNTTITKTTITIEDVEALASALEADEAAERAKLERLIRAEARILAVREPGLFEAQALEYADEDGHWDNSYPPGQSYRVYTGPRLIEVREPETVDVATSPGYYHTWRRVTEDPGLYVDREGRIWGCDESGTGRIGSFAAHPGNCDVEVTLEWERRHDVSVEELREVERHLRQLAFPLTQGAAA